MRLASGRIRFGEDDASLGENWLDENPFDVIIKVYKQGGVTTRAAVRNEFMQWFQFSSQLLALNLRNMTQATIGMLIQCRHSFAHKAASVTPKKPLAVPMSSPSMV